jgi:hypothetical protein
VRTTLTLDDDVAALLEKENRRAGEPMKQTVNRMLRLGLADAIRPVQRERFVVKPFDTDLTSADWKAWEETETEETLSHADVRMTDNAA